MEWAYVAANANYGLGLELPEEASIHDLLIGPEGGIIGQVREGEGEPEVPTVKTGLGLGLIASHYGGGGALGVDVWRLGWYAQCRISVLLFGSPFGMDLKLRLHSYGSDDAFLGEETLTASALIGFMFVPYQEPAAPGG